MITVPERVIIGGRGLVGSAFCRYFDQHGLPYEVIQREDAHSHGIKACGLLINAGGNANKGQANANPAWDFEQSVGNIAPYFQSIRAKSVIHISTVDVYPDPSAQDHTQEAGPINVKKLSVYGFHKWLTEQYVQRFASNYLILRLPALVGPGLTKNPVFDYFEPGKPVFVAPSSKLNVLHVDDIAGHAFRLIELGLANEIVNIAANQSVTISDFPKCFGGGSDFADTASDNEQYYEINTEKAARMIKLCSSADAIERYRDEL
jgi:nucleoside-diphosphate-sugar epimerase